MKEISGDVPLSKRERIVYLLRNFVRGVGGYRCRDRSRAWRPRRFVYSDESPGRHYIDAFLREVVPELMPRKEIAVLDIGCGSGYLREILDDLGYHGRYVGVDVVQSRDYESTERPGFASRLILQPIEQVSLTESFDFVFSNTALEHIEDDAAALERARAATTADGVQIHIVPSFWSLFLYLWHGYRQYHPCAMNALFAQPGVSIHRLGGFFSFLLHFAYITVPEGLVLRGRSLRHGRLYAILVRTTLKLDSLVPFWSAFYAVVLRAKP